VRRSGKKPAIGRFGRFGRFAKGRPNRTRAAGEADDRPPLKGVARGALMLVAFLCMVGFAVVLAKLTLVPSPASVSLVHPNFTPGASIRAYVDQPAVRDTVKQIGGNVVLGVPFGFLLPVVFPKTRGLVRVVAVTAFVMLCVETAQGTMVEGRAFDIDDVILNTFGALLGYVFVGRRLGRSVHPRRRHWWRRRTDAASSGTG
jgi:glycopeptide antibiotics resistance protein